MKRKFLLAVVIAKGATTEVFLVLGFGLSLVRGHFDSFERLWSRLKVSFPPQKTIQLIFLSKRDCPKNFKKRNSYILVGYLPF